ncbi:MAG TPA: glycosyl hydrolase family 28 protein [Pirellulales bacterium]|jgi:polygalacturonase|nr:glycosyl hydrolase family 28 protein [Pirellulales bacterium]
MSKGKSRSVSRRRLITAASVPMMAVALESGLFNGRAQAAEAAVAGSAEKNLAGMRVFNVREYGAKGDGTTLDTKAVQAAIDACAEDRGGVVLVPAGAFLIAPIELKSNVTLHIAAGGKLLATTDPALYHPVRGIPINGDHTMGDGNVGLLFAAEAENITIEGPGVIDGQGKQVRAAGLNGINRCHLLLFYHCTNLTIRDVYMFQSSYHTCRICNSSYINLDGIRIFSRVTGNNDGFHFISADHVTLSNCEIRCQDDACALFGSCQFIMVTNCLFSTRWSVFRFGGGTAKNVAVSNCVMYQVYGCPIKLHCEPGSLFENMSFSNLVMEDVSGPFYLGVGRQMRRQQGGDQAGKSDGNAAAANEKGTAKAENAPTEKAADSPAKRSPGTIRNISFSNISGTVVTKISTLDDSEALETRSHGVTNIGEQHSCIVLNCVEGQVMENISLSDIRLTFGGGGTAEDAARRDLPQIAGEYFSLGAMPAYGLYARNVRGLMLNNIRFQVATAELRPAVILSNVQDVSMLGLSAEGNPEAESLLRFINTADTLITAPRVLTSVAVFLRVEGAKNKTITIDGGDISKASKPLDFADGASETAVKLRG